MSTEMQIGTATVTEIKSHDKQKLKRYSNRQNKLSCMANLNKGPLDQIKAMVSARSKCRT